MNEFATMPLWVQASYLFFYGGMFTLGLVFVSLLVDLFPALYRLGERLLGGDDA